MSLNYRGGSFYLLLGLTVLLGLGTDNRTVNIENCCRCSFIGRFGSGKFMPIVEAYDTGFLEVDPKGKLLIHWGKLKNPSKLYIIGLTQHLVLARFQTSPAACEV